MPDSRKRKRRGDPGLPNGHEDARPARRELVTQAHAGTSAGPSCPGHGPITSIRGGWDLAVGSVTLVWRKVFHVEIVDGRPLMCMVPSLVGGAGRLGIGPVDGYIRGPTPIHSSLLPCSAPFSAPSLLRVLLRPDPPQPQAKSGPTAPAPTQPATAAPAAAYPG